MFGITACALSAYVPRRPPAHASSQTDEPQRRRPQRTGTRRRRDEVRCLVEDAVVGQLHLVVRARDAPPDRSAGALCESALGTVDEAHQQRAAVRGGLGQVVQRGEVVGDEAGLQDQVLGG
jgi:hypothetical protein